VSGSFIEQRAMEDLFGTPALASVKLLNNAGAQAAAGGAEFSLIQGETLDAASAPGIYARLGAAMQVEETLLNAYKPRAPKLFAVTDALTVDGFNGVAFILYPSQPKGEAAAFLANAMNGAQLGSWQDTPSSTQCTDSGSGEGPNGGPSSSNCYTS